MEKNKKISIEFFRKENIQQSVARDLLIIMNFEGTVHVKNDDYECHLKENDITIINLRSKYSVITSDGVFVIFTLKKNEFEQCFNTKNYRFLCDSSKEWNSNYTKLKNYLFSIISILNEKNRYQYIKLNQTYYDLVMLLVNNFSIEIVNRTMSESEKLMSYVDENYEKPLSLKSAADDFAMSEAYFSKYFKKVTGKNFYKYLTEVRLTHAYEDIRETNKSILEISLDNGFPNASSFSSYFKEKYGAHPNEFRKDIKNAERNTDLNDALKYINTELKLHEDEMDVELDNHLAKDYRKTWNTVLNYGDLKTIDLKSVTDQLAKIKTELKYEYIRVTVDELFPDNIDGTMAQRCDILVDLGYKIWLAIDYRKVQSEYETVCFLDRFISFFANRYSISAVRHWKVELCYNTIFDEAKCDSYFKIYDALDEVVKKYKFNSSLMGVGISLCNREGIKYLYDYMEKKNIIVEEQTFTSEPIAYYINDTGVTACKLQNNNLYDELMTLKLYFPYYEKFVKKTYIVSSRDLLQKYNLLNDSCYVGAKVIEKCIQCFGMIDGLSNNIALDLLEVEPGQNGLLFGAAGLLSMNGAEKPNYHAFVMMERVGNKFVGKNDHLIVFANHDGNFNVVCHNAKPFGHKYYLNEGNFTYHNIHECFDDTNDLRINLVIKNVTNGSYILKTRMVSKEGGSIQDAYMNMTKGKDVYIHPHDASFIKAISIPSISLEEFEVHDNHLHIQITLPANAFANVHVIRKL